jgi:hypothetical protein
MSDAVSVTNGRVPRLLHDPLLYGTTAFALLVCGPFARYLGSLADEGILLHGATRLLQGEVMYRDFFEIVPPGGFLIAATWMTIVGADFGSTRALAVAMIAAIAALLYGATVLASGHRLLAVLLATAWAVRAPFENNHHWFTTAASMASAVCVFLALDDSRPGRATAFAAGLFGGVALMVTQTRGGLLCLAVLVVLLTLPDARGRVVSAVTGMAVWPAALVLFLALTGALSDAADSLIWFTSHRYVGVQHLRFGSFATWTDAVTVAVFPAALLLILVAVALKPHGAIWRDPRGGAALALAIVGVLGAFPRPDIAHLNFTVPLACPLVALGLTYVTGRLRRVARLAVTAVVIGLCLVAVAYATKRRVDVSGESLETISTPRGTIVRRPAPWTTDFARLMAQLDRVPAGDPIFFYPYLPMLPYLSGRQHVAATDVMVPGYTTPAQFSAACARVMRDARWLVVDRTWSDPRKLRVLFPAMTDQNPPEKRAFEAAVAQAFDTVVHRSPTFEVRRRGTGAAHCPSP